MKTKEATNKALVVEAFETLFDRRDYARAEPLWSASYIQHSAHIAPGREGLFGLVKGLPPPRRYEHGLVVAEGDFVLLHGRFSGHGLPTQDEATRAQSKSGQPMFGRAFSS